MLFYLPSCGRDARSAVRSTYDAIVMISAVCNQIALEWYLNLRVKKNSERERGDFKVGRKSSSGWQC